MLYNKNDILGFETDTVWGIGCHPFNQNSVDKIYELKGRDKSKPLILMSSKLEYLTPFVKSMPNYANFLIERYFPGALTLIFEKSDICPSYVTSGFSTVGIRIPNHKGFYGIAENFEGHVLATTSLNLSNMPPVKNYNEAKELFKDKITVIEPDNSNKPIQKASTVVLCTGDEPKVLRQGEIFI